MSLVAPLVQLCAKDTRKRRAAVVISAVVAALLWRYRQLRQEFRSGESARVVWCPPTKDGMSVRRKQLASQIADIVARCPSFHTPAYMPPVFAAGTFSNLALFLLKQWIERYLRLQCFSRQRIVCPDGGVVAIDWADDDVTKNLPPNAPIVIFLHTVSGSAEDCRHYTRAAADRGWRSCVFIRRGHGGELLRTAQFNVMGDVSDTKLQVSRVVAQYPDAYIGMCGISAGSGLLVTYLGKEGELTPVQAACSLCPAYDISQAFVMFAKRFPVVDRILLWLVRHLFIERNKSMLQQLSPETVANCLNATTVHEFLESHYPFAGVATLDEYYAANNPMGVINTLVRPLLLVNADDDLVCLKENIREDIIRTTGGALLLHTKRGSHVAYNNGLFGIGDFLPAISMDFLETARYLNIQSNACTDEAPSF